jgi:hypothetical protein
MKCFLQLLWVMPSRVVDLFACWWTGGSPQNAVVWKMEPFCLLREINNWNFKGQERPLEELKSFFYSLFTWIVAFLAPLMISFNDFLVCFFS